MMDNFICWVVFFTCYANNTAPTCFINDNSYEFKQMTCKHGQGWSLEYKV